MQYKFIGDTLEFKNFLGSNGTPIITATANVDLYDGFGKLQTATIATHTANGTYALSLNSSSWGKGLVLERWRFTGDFGTQMQDLSDSYRLNGTELIRTYIVSDELPTFYENVEDYFDGTEGQAVLDAYHEVNKRLEALNHKTPFSVNPDGYFDQPLRDLNAYEAIFRLVQKRQSSFVRDGRERPWFFAFKDSAEKVYKAIENKAYNFSIEYGAGDSGIGVATRASGTGLGTLETNWRGGVGNGFSDSSYGRTWACSVIGTGTSGGVFECTYTWSKNDGLTIEGTKTTSTEWAELDNGVYVRFHRGESSATSGLFSVGDTWKFNTYPKLQSVGGKKTAISY